MKTILSKSKIGTLLLVLFLILAIQYLGLSKHRKQTATVKYNKHVLTVSDAKEFAMKLESKNVLVNIKGIYTGNLAIDKNGIQLEDAEPSGLEDMLLYCMFNPGDLKTLNVKPGAEITVTGTLNRKQNYIEVTACKLICINEAVKLNDFTEITE